MNKKNLEFYEQYTYHFHQIILLTNDKSIDNNEIITLIA